MCIRGVDVCIDRGGGACRVREERVDVGGGTKTNGGTRAEGERRGGLIVCGCVWRKEGREQEGGRGRERGRTTTREQKRGRRSKGKGSEEAKRGVKEKRRGLWVCGFCSVSRCAPVGGEGGDRGAVALCPGESFLWVILQSNPTQPKPTFVLEPINGSSGSSPASQTLVSLGESPKIQSQTMAQASPQGQSDTPRPRVLVQTSQSG